MLARWFYSSWREGEWISIPNLQQRSVSEDYLAQSLAQRTCKPKELRRVSLFGDDKTTLDAAHTRFAAA